MPMNSDLQIPVERILFTNATLVNISVTNNPAVRVSALYVGVSGDVVADVPGVGSQILFKNLIAGRIAPFFVTQVYKVGTTATNMVYLE